MYNFEPTLCFIKFSILAICLVLKYRMTVKGKTTCRKHCFYVRSQWHVAASNVSCTTVHWICIVCYLIFCCDVCLSDWAFIGECDDNHVRVLWRHCACSWMRHWRWILCKSWRRASVAWLLAIGASSARSGRVASSRTTAKPWAASPTKNLCHGCTALTSFLSSNRCASPSSGHSPLDHVYHSVMSLAFIQL